MSQEDAAYVTAIFSQVILRLTVTAVAAASDLDLLDFWRTYIVVLIVSLRQLFLHFSHTTRGVDWGMCLESN